MKLEEMIPIPIADFLVTSACNVDLYVRLTDEKFILLTKAGQRTSPEQMKSYREKEVSYLWVKKEDYYKLSEQAVALAGLAMRKGELDVGQKIHILTTAAEMVFNQLDHMGVGLSLYQDAKMVTEATVTLVQSHRTLSSVFASLKECSDELLRHSMAVSTLSALIGQALKWEKRTTLEKLALGGLLHDIGKKTLPPELMLKPRALMTAEENQIYETHPYRGMQLMISLGVVPDDVVSIIYEHHENSIGQGFPQRIRDMKMHPLAKVVAIANQFANLTIQGLNNPHPKTPREALMYIEYTMGQPFNKDCFKALRSIIEAEPSSRVA